MKDDKLWRVFSLYVRLRDSDENGNGKCITCGKLVHYQSAHCGHFISRRYLATKFDEQNNALQCVSCNTYNQGRQFEYALAIDRKYGKGTAEKLYLKSKQTCKRGKFEIDEMTKYYKKEVEKLKAKCQ